MSASRKPLPHKQAGFTLVEVLIATLIFALSIFAIVQSRSASLRSVRESERMLIGVQLAQEKITESELKYQKLLDRDGLGESDLKEEGAFEKNFADYKYTVVLKKSGVEITTGMMQKFFTDLGAEPEAVAEQMNKQALVLTNLNKLIKANFAELSVTVTWEEFGRKYSVPLTTHLIPARPKVELTATTETSS